MCTCTYLMVHPESTISTCTCIVGVYYNYYGILLSASAHFQASAHSQVSTHACTTGSTF